MSDEIETLLDEVRLLFNALVQRAERLHAGRNVSVSQRAVLEYLHRHGPATVPQIARRRRVSRQHIQALVNPLLELALLARDENPDHRRSVLIRLTPDGETTIAGMRAAEAAYFDRAGAAVPKRELARASEVLRTLRESIETTD